ncbi:MAG: hypothetical protein M1814_000204 [Vezdaea aestivalis]|nr:MAG: hypothetical protein M1814_000204 [Vezdaea aestivalis]
MEDQNHPNLVPGDPVVKSWKVFYNPHPDDDRKLFLLDYVTRMNKEPLTSKYKGQQVLEVRVKDATGQVELDFNIETSVGYDADVGLRYSTALNGSGLLNAGGSYGLAGGLSTQHGTPSGAAQVKKQHQSGSPAQVDQPLVSPSRTNSKVSIYSKQTIGGHLIPKSPQGTTFMLGTFDEGQPFPSPFFSRTWLTEPDGLHLTPVDAIVQMLPEYQHIDAVADQGRVTKRLQREAVEPREPGEARAVQMSVKSADGEEFDVGDLHQQLANNQSEQWTRMAYHFEDANIAREIHNNFTRSQSSARTTSLKAAQGKEQFFSAIFDETEQSEKDDAWGWGFKDGKVPQSSEVNEDQTNPDVGKKTTTTKPKSSRAKSGGRKVKSVTIDEDADLYMRDAA